MALPDKLRFHLSTAYDFLFFPYKARNYDNYLKELKEPPLDGRIEPDETIMNWVSLFNEKVSDSIDELLSLFFDEEAFFGLCTMQEISLSGIPDASTFMDYISEMPAKEILRRFLYSGYGPRGGQTIPDDLLDRLLRNENELLEFLTKKMSFPSRQKAVLFEFFSDPEETKVKYQFFLEWFYDEMYKTIEPMIRKKLPIMKKGIEDFLTKEGERGLEKISWYAVGKEGTRQKDITIAVAYSLETERANASLPGKSELLVICGANLLDKLSIEKDPDLLATEIFKALSDPKKFEILKLVSKNPLTGNELAEAMKETNMVISHSLVDLRAAGLVRYEINENDMTVYSTDRLLVENKIQQAMKTIFNT